MVGLSLLMILQGIHLFFEELELLLVELLVIVHIVDFEGQYRVLSPLLGIERPNDILVVADVLQELVLGYLAIQILVEVPEEVELLILPALCHPCTHQKGKQEC